MSETLENVLNDSDQQNVEQQEAEQSEQTGEESKGSTPGTEDETTKEAGQEPWTKTAYLDEKRKRQELEKTVNDLQSRIVDQSKSEPETDSQFDWDNPDKTLNKINESVNQNLSVMRTEMSQDMMRMMHDDYDEKELAFVDLVKQEPGLSQSN